jgi:hypothetical protein
MFKRAAPLSYEAWIDYDVAGARMSRMEMEILRGATPAANYSLVGLKSALGSDREVDEFLAKLTPKPTPDFELDLSKAVDGAVFEERFAAGVTK